VEASRQHKQNYHSLFDFGANFRCAHEIFSRRFRRKSIRLSTSWFLSRIKCSSGTWRKAQTAGQFVAKEVAGVLEGASDGILLFSLPRIPTTETLA
jgi:hypothetical protein